MTIQKFMQELAHYPLNMEILGTHNGQVMEIKIYEAQGYFLIDTDEGRFKKQLVNEELRITDE